MKRIILIALFGVLLLSGIVLIGIPLLASLGILPCEPSGAVEHAKNIMKSKEGVVFTDKEVGEWCCGVTYYYLISGDDWYITHDFWLYRRVALEKPYQIEYTDVNFLKLWGVHQ